MVPELPANAGGRQHKKAHTPNATGPAGHQLHSQTKKQQKINNNNKKRRRQQSIISMLKMYLRKAKKKNAELNDGSCPLNNVAAKHAASRHEGKTNGDREVQQVFLDDDCTSLRETRPSCSGETGRDDAVFKRQKKKKKKKNNRVRSPSSKEKGTKDRANGHTQLEVPVEYKRMEVIGVGRVETRDVGVPENRKTKKLEVKEERMEVEMNEGSVETRDVGVPENRKKKKLEVKEERMEVEMNEGSVETRDVGVPENRKKKKLEVKEERMEVEMNEGSVETRDVGVPEIDLKKRIKKEAKEKRCEMKSSEETRDISDPEKNIKKKKLKEEVAKGKMEESKGGKKKKKLKRVVNESIGGEVDGDVDGEASQTTKKNNKKKRNKALVEGFGIEEGEVPRESRAEKKKEKSKFEGDGKSTKTREKVREGNDAKYKGSCLSAAMNDKGEEVEGLDTNRDMQTKKKRKRKILEAVAEDSARDELDGEPEVRSSAREVSDGEPEVRRIKKKKKKKDAEEEGAGLRESEDEGKKCKEKRTKKRKRAVEERSMESAGGGKGEEEVVKVKKKKDTSKTKEKSLVSMEPSEETGEQEPQKKRTRKNKKGEKDRGKEENFQNSSEEGVTKNAGDMMRMVKVKQEKDPEGGSEADKGPSDVVFLSARPGNQDEVSIDQARRLALQRQIDEESQPKARFGQWDTAHFNSTDRQMKFLRLMGGFKKGSQPIGQDSGRFNMALGKESQQTLQQDLLGEFQRAQNRRMDFQNKGAGLGFTAPSNKKFAIDASARNSIRLDD